MRPGRRPVASAVALSLILAACSGGGGGEHEGAAGERTTRTDSAGNVIAAGEDWSAGTTGGADGAAASGAGATDEGTTGGASGGASGRTDGTEPPCGVPTTTPAQGGAQAPPGFDPDAPLADAEDDFPMEATITPTRGDPGDKIKIQVVAVGQPDALVAILARFYDGDHHGLRAAKFTDATGRVTLEGPVPLTAPVGISKITVSVSNRNEQSALEVLDFVVTGPGCP